MFESLWDSAARSSAALRECASLLFLLRVWLGPVGSGGYVAWVVSTFAAFAARYCAEKVETHH
jgi:hypothetical protein